jgi:hypothetical protein
VQGLTWLLFLGSSVHVAATGFLYTLPEVREHATTNKGRYIYSCIALVIVTGCLASMFGPSQLDRLLLAYFSWQFFHFHKQNVGMAALAANAYGSGVITRAGRGTLLVAACAGILGLVTRPGLLQLNVQVHLDTLHSIAVFAFVAAVGWGIQSRLTRPSADRPLGYSVVYLTSLGFFAPVFLFHSPYAAVAGMTIAHGLQYLLLVGMVAGGGSKGSGRVIALATFLNIAIVGGIGLSVASHLHGGPVAERFIYGVYLGLVMAHFVVDAGLWRLRDPFARAFLSKRLPYLVSPNVPRPVRPVIDRQPI